MHGLPAFRRNSYLQNLMLHIVPLHHFSVGGLALSSDVMAFRSTIPEKDYPLDM